MLKIDPSWSVVFDVGVCAAVVWLAWLLPRRRLFRPIGRPVLVGLALVLCVPVLVLGKVFSLAVSLAAVPWLAIEAYNDTEQPLPKRTKALLSTGRILVFLLLILCMLRPRLEYVTVDTHRACAAILADVSLSMAEDFDPRAELQDIPDDERQTRYDVLREILREHEPLIAELNETFDCRLATFADGYRRLERLDELPGAPPGARTNLARALVDARRHLGTARTAGVILLTDGRHNVGHESVADAARLLGVPARVICVAERPEEKKDVVVDTAEKPDPSVERVDHPRRVFLENTALIEATIAYVGPETDELITVKLTEENRVVGVENLKTPPPNGTRKVTFQYMPETTGLKKLHVKLLARRDTDIQNNSKEVYVRASDAPLAVLFIEGEVRWEYKFLRRAIAAAENIKLTCLNAFLAGEGARLLPKTEKEWKGLSLLVLGDIPADRFSPAELGRVKQFVADGGSLLMLGGFHSLGPGGYADTPVAEILPVVIRPDDGQVQDPVRVDVTEDGLEHDALVLGPGKNTAKIWRSLPPLSGYTQVAGVKAAAKVLLRAARKDGGTGAPILVIQRYREGRTAVFTANTTWRWIFNREGKTARYHKAFWRQHVQWLTRSGYGGKTGKLSCKTDRLTYFVGERPRLTVWATGNRFRDATIAALVEGPPSAESFRMDITRDMLGREVGLPRTMQAEGRYRVVVTADVPGPVTPDEEKNLRAEAPFAVEHRASVETENTKIDVATARQIAELTDGGLYFRDNAGEAFRAVCDREIRTEIRRPTFRRLWDNLFMYVALGGLLCAEWATRKRKGLA
ncbi:MAG: glutamine amidotransferase [Planctomycetota bacterium]